MKVAVLRIAPRTSSSLKGPSRSAIFGLFFKGGEAEEKPVKQVELEALLAAPDGFGDDVPVDPTLDQNATQIMFLANLDQLDNPETGTLYLLSLQVADDVLAANTLPLLVERRSTLIASDEDAQRLFESRLVGVGYNPAHAERYTRKFRILREELYRVEDSFPRLTRLSFPGGVPAIPLPAG